MFRLLLALLLVNISSRSFGSPFPLPTKVSNGSLISDLFVALAPKCNHSFLTAQITSKLKDCNVPLSPFREKQFECLTFYDINKQLCDAVSSSSLMLTDIETVKLNESVNIDNLCAMAKHWNVSNIAEIPSYKNTIEQIFNSEITCVKVCGVTDILSQDSNAYCKYFKWGMEMLPSTTSAAASNSDIYVPSETSQRSSSSQPVAINNVVPIVNPGNTTSNLSGLGGHDTIKTSEVKPENTATINEAKPVVNIQPWSPNRAAPNPGTINVSEKIPLETNGIASNVAQEKPIESPLSMDTGDVEMEKPSAAEVEPSKKDDVANHDDLPKKQSVDNKESSLGNEKSKSQINDPDDYPGDSDLEEGKDLTLTDMQGGDDGDDPMLSDPDIKQDLNLPKKSTKKIESMVSYNNGEMELFPNTMQDGFSADDDHFFPFFLTAVILVVLLYVLYHNKNKVSKVVMGLIVEGRQPGRRRNSRGHAYRRLDTLEQAMSANTAAPPSKIIY